MCASSIQFMALLISVRSMPRRKDAQPHSGSRKARRIRPTARHAQSERNVAKEIAKAGGLPEVWTNNVRDLDTPLTPTGVQQAIATGAFLRDSGDFDVIFSSPYMRALQTTQHIISQLRTAPP